MGSGLTVTQLICAPRSRKYSVAVVPTGSFCRTSSSFRDLPSAERQAQLRSYPGPHPLRPLPPTATGVGAEPYSLGSRRRDWRAGYHCGSAGRVGVTAHSREGPEDPQLLQLRTRLWPVWLQDTARKSTGRSRKLSFRKPSKGIPTSGHTRALQQASPESPGLHHGHLCRHWGERLPGGVPPRGPCPEGLREAVRPGPGLTALSEEVLDLCDGSMGLHLREARAGGKSGPLVQDPSC